MKGKLNLCDLPDGNFYLVLLGEENTKERNENLIRNVIRKTQDFKNCQVTVAFKKKNIDNFLDCENDYELISSNNVLFKKEFQEYYDEDGYDLQIEDRTIKLILFDKGKKDSQLEKFRNDSILKLKQA